MSQNHSMFSNLLPCLKTDRTGYRMSLRLLAVILTCYASTLPAIAETDKKLPHDLTAFFHDAEICQYLSGEWDSTLPQKRKNELSNEDSKLCSDIHIRQERLRKKYARDRTILSKLDSYDF